ncbi:MAG: AmmeMemoRadiSam system protein B [Candidatus Kerfeldbacteria bacterium]|nr:AmmeMemoRadiSam system protein B [Candidatus Kerfeldbacteria bacterium]
MRYAKVVIILSISLFLIGSAIYFSNAVNGRPASTVVHRSFFVEQEFFDLAYTRNTPPAPEGMVRGGIIPHHLIASHVIAEFFQGIESVQSPEVIVLIGPDHLNRSDYHIATSVGSWYTPYGILYPHTPIIESMAADGVVTIDESLFDVEHSITSEVAFIRRSFPRASIVPITIQQHTSAEELTQLGDWLAQRLPENSLVLVSVDFAHNVNHRQAMLQNAASIELLKTMDPETTKGIYVDSPASLSVLFHYLHERRVGHVQILDSLDTVDVTGDTSIPAVTSYITAYFW